MRRSNDRELRRAQQEAAEAADRATQAAQEAEAAALRAQRLRGQPEREASPDHAAIEARWTRILRTLHRIRRLQRYSHNIGIRLQDIPQGVRQQARPRR